MSKIHLTAAVALALAAAAPVASAQTAATHSIQTDEIRASKMIGSVDDVILNKNGKVDAVVIDVGSFLGMGGKDVAVLPSDIKTDNNRLTLDRTKEQLQQMATYDLKNTNTGAGTSTSPVEGGKLQTAPSTGR